MLQLVPFPTSTSTTTVANATFKQETSKIRTNQRIAKRMKTVSFMVFRHCHGWLSHQQKQQHKTIFSLYLIYHEKSLSTKLLDSRKHLPPRPNSVNPHIFQIIQGQQGHQPHESETLANISLTLLTLATKSWPLTTHYYWRKSQYHRLLMDSPSLLYWNP